MSAAGGAGAGAWVPPDKASQAYVYTDIKLERSPETLDDIVAGGSIYNAISNLVNSCASEGGGVYSMSEPFENIYPGLLASIFSKPNPEYKVKINIKGTTPYIYIIGDILKIPATIFENAKSGAIEKFKEEFPLAFGHKGGARRSRGRIRSRRQKRRSRRHRSRK